MVKQWIKGKLGLLGTLGVSILAIVVAGVSTAAWFELERAPIETELVSGSPDLDIQSVTGYKVEHTIGAYGQEAYTPSNIVSRQSNGTGLDIQSTDNDDLEGDDINYDIPDQGIGYYIIWPNNEGLLRYTRTDDGAGNITRNYAKFQKMQYGNKYFATFSIDSSNTECKIKKYTFDNSTTVNKQVSVTTAAWPAHEVEKQDNGNVLFKITGTYTLWFDTNDLSDSGTPKSYYVSNVYAQQTTSGAKSLLPKGLISNSGEKKAVKRAWDDRATGTLTIYFSYPTWGNNSAPHIRLAKNSDPEYNQNGTEMTYAFTNESNQKVYRYTINLSSYNRMRILFWQNSTKKYSQNYTISANSSTGYYVSDTWSGDQFNFGTWDCPEYTYYFLNRYNGVNNLLGSTPYAHAWNNSTSKTYQDVSFPGQQTMKVSDYLYKIIAPKPMDRILFAKSDSSKQTADLTVSSSQNGKVFVITGVDGSSHYTGVWQTLNATTNTFYLYDPSYWLGEEVPEVHYWNSLSLENDDVSMSVSPSAFSTDSPDVTGRIFSITVPAKYDRIQFVQSDNTSIRTEDLTLTGNEGRAFILGTAAYNGGLWSDGLDCFYLDTSSGISWSTVQMLNSNGSVVIYSDLSRFRVATDFYKIYYSKSKYSWVRFRDANNQGSRDGNSGAVNVGSRASNYIYIGTTHKYDDEPTQHREILCANPNQSGSNIGVATIKISTDGGEHWKDPITESTSNFTTKMSVGDVTKDNNNFSNYFIYEMGLEIPYGARVKVEVVASGDSDYDSTFASKIVKTYSGTSTCATTYGGTGPNAGSTIQYLNVQASYIEIKKPTGAVGTSARFNFYIFNDKGNSNNGKLSITMIPKRGNGYYIMDYGTISGSTTEGFVDATKMSSVSNNYATYNGFYAKDGDRIFVRKYIDTIDELCPTITINGASAHHVTDGGLSSKGIIEFDSDDYYLIEVNGTSVTVSTYTHDTFFQLGPLDTSNISNQSAISDQYVSLVLDVKFNVKAANLFGLNIALEASIPESLRPYVGVQFYYGGTSALGSPYVYMRTNYESTLKTYDNLNTLLPDTITAAQSAATELHAYILIDYVAGSLNNIPGYITDTISFKLVTSYENSSSSSAA